MRPLPALAALLLAAMPVALPAAAQTVTHGVDGRFGVAYASDARDARGGARGIHDAQYTMTIHQPFDNGWSLGVSIAVGFGNVERRGPRYHPAAQPGLRFADPRS